MNARLSIICSRQSNDSYFAVCPEVRGCFTQGDTYEEAVENLKELVGITIKEEKERESLQDALFSTSKIFSEFEIAV